MSTFAQRYLARLKGGGGMDPFDVPKTSFQAKNWKLGLESVHSTTEFALIKGWDTDPNNWTIHQDETHSSRGAPLPETPEGEEWV